MEFPFLDVAINLSILKGLSGREASPGKHDPALVILGLERDDLAHFLR